VPPVLVGPDGVPGRQPGLEGGGLAGRVDGLGGGLVVLGGGREQGQGAGRGGEQSGEPAAAHGRPPDGGGDVRPGLFSDQVNRRTPACQISRRRVGGVRPVRRRDTTIAPVARNVYKCTVRLRRVSNNG